MLVIYVYLYKCAVFNTIYTFYFGEDDAKL